MKSDSSISETKILLDRLKAEIPEIWDQTQVVGTWVWLQFEIEPSAEVRAKLRSLGFHWNARRQTWQHPCASEDALPGHEDPRSYFPVRRPNELSRGPRPSIAHEYKVVSLRECPLPQEMRTFDTPDKAAEYWRLHIATAPYFNPECECFVVLLLNTRRYVKGHQLVSIGTLDTILVSPREVFRLAVVASAAAVILLHNHPSGDTSPSEADIRVTRELIRAGQLMKIEVLDHVVVSTIGHSSLRELGFFYS